MSGDRQERTTDAVVDLELDTTVRTEGRPPDQKGERRAAAWAGDHRSTGTRTGIEPSATATMPCCTNPTATDGRSDTDARVSPPSAAGIREPTGFGDR